MQLKDKKEATRVAFGKEIVRLGKLHPHLVVLEADLGKSTQSIFFKNAYPNRYFQLGISEANAIGIASGLALAGNIAFACSFSVFLTGRYDTIRMSVCSQKANVKLIGTHSGIAVGEDGMSQQAIEDISVMRSLPNMIVLQPSDSIETIHMLRDIVDRKGPAFIRLSRHPLERINSENYQYHYQKGVLLKEGKDVTLFCTGATVYNCLEASKILNARSISTRVVNINWIKPIDIDIIIESAKKTRMLFSVEDHSIIGGLGSSIAEVITEFFPKHFIRIGIQDAFGESGSIHDLYKKYHLNIEGIIEHVIQNYSKIR